MKEDGTIHMEAYVALREAKLEIIKHILDGMWDDYSRSLVLCKIKTTWCTLCGSKYKDDGTCECQSDDDSDE